MTSTAIRGRALAMSDLLRDADCEFEQVLVASARHWCSTTPMPSVAEAGAPFAVEIDASALADQLGAIAWAGGEHFEVHDEQLGGARVKTPLPNPAIVANIVNSGATVIAPGAEEHIPAIAHLCDGVTSAWNTRLSASVVLSASDLELDLREPTLFAVADGCAELGDTGLTLVPDEGVVVPAGTQAITIPYPTTLVRVNLEVFDPTAIIAQLKRTAGHYPQFRADLPRWPEMPFTSYAGSLLDDPGALARATLEVFDAGVPEQAKLRWNASLRFAPRSLDHYLRPSRWKLRWPAPPAFGDRRQRWGPEGAIVLATAGRIVVIEPEQSEALHDLAGDGTITSSSPLFGTLTELGLLTPA